ncbi:ATP12 family chaperone protein [Neorhizobium sp. JUb45]|uniref:ATP12 family chaperone protein n=1 Tax=unclassified Neorhizobium TaxID=2629175 RepID=UPI001048E065|nr:ATP12 family chaperone protein [Neorhizobium sp. JUb45]TCR07163.1 chaperone required for assembly of F1-ATPase [Neorhizobium sp. JUb45]
MRDILSETHIDLSHEDPTRRAQIQMHKPLPKRFYKEVTVVASDDGHAVHLDGKAVKTPAKNQLMAPTEALAALLRDEWDAQTDVVNPATMPITRLVNTAIDGIATDPQAVVEDMLRFSASDALCYRADQPEGLVERQRAQWDPVLDWAADDLGARFILIEGIMPQEQPRDAISAFGARLRNHQSPVALAALHTITSLTGSAILALAFAEGRLSVDETWALAHLDEDWTIEHWGTDEEAEVRRAKRYEEMKAAAQSFEALKS